MTTFQMILTVAVIALGTVLTRGIAFMAFPAGRDMPPFVSYLSKVLPSAALGLLVIYCLRNVDVTQGSHGLPELIALTVVTALHLWRKNLFLSILTGTAVYMLLVNLVFVQV